MTNADFFIHDSDRQALNALKAIPGFSQLFKAFMKVWNEKIFRIENMSSNLRVSDKQLSKYYDMLVPICEKLQIEVPELYLKLDVEPNAGTYGDTKPFIVVNTGLLENMPEELIPTILAHECGHIACHHSLYTTIGDFVLNTAEGILNNFLGLGNILLQPIQIAFYHWMRCSELSADRAAAICDGDSDKIVKTCLHFSGYDKDIDGNIDVDEFMNQALEYREMVKDSKWNKTLEFLMYNKRSHPLNAVRAYECSQWAKTERFEKIAKYFNAQVNNISLAEYLGEIPMSESDKAHIGKNVFETKELFMALGFTDVKITKITQKSLTVKNGQVLNIRIDGKEGFDMCEWFPVNSQVDIEYYEPETEDEVAAAHPGQVRIPNSFKRYIGKEYEEVVKELSNAGFTQIILEEKSKHKKGWLSKNNEIAFISIGGQTQFEKGEWFAKDIAIKIVYNTYSGN